MSFAQKLFRFRSYTPLPFLILMLIFAEPTALSLVSGFALVALGEFLRAWGVFYVGSETRVTGEVGAGRLVMSGPFGHVRNPLYVGNQVIYLGVGVMSLALFPWLQIAGALYFFWQYTVIVKEEERFLSEKFGKTYREYSRAVPRFFLRLTPYQPPVPHSIDWKAGWHSEARTLQALIVVVFILIALWIVQ